jgi:predicted MFS family arabinose efflux permease
MVQAVRMSRTGLPVDVVLLGFVLFLVVSASNVLTPLLPLVQREFGIDYAAAGAVVSSFAVARLALDLPAGFLEDRLGARRLAALGFVSSLLGALVAATGPSLPLVVVGRVAMGLGTSIVSVVVLTTLGRRAPPEARSRVLAVYPMANNSAISVFPAVGGVVGSLWGWRSTMLLCAALTLIAALLLARLLGGGMHEAQASSSGSADGGRRSAVGDARPTAAGAAAGASSTARPGRWSLVGLGLLYLGVVIFMINRHGFRNTALPLFAHDRIGLDPVQIASGITLMAVVGLIVAIPGAMVADRWGRRRVIAVGFVLVALGDLAFLGATSYVSYLLAAFAVGIGDFFSASQTALLAESVPPAWRNRVLAGYRFGADLGGTVGPVFLATLLQVAGFEAMLLVISSLLLLAGLGAALGGLAPRRHGLARSDQLAGRAA